MRVYNSQTDLQKITYIFKYLHIILATIGISSNVLTFCVYSRERMKKYSFSLYIKVMACTDTIVLLHAFRHWASYVIDANIDLVSSFFCTINEYQPYVGATSSLGLITLISLDRLITIAFPNQFKILKSRYFQIGMVLTVLTYCLLVFVEIPLNYQLISEQNSTQCFLDTKHIKIVSIINLMNLLFFNILVNNVLNAFMIVVLFRSRQKLTRGSDNVYKRDRKFAFNAIGLNLMSTFSKMPITAALIAIPVFKLSPDEIEMMFAISVFAANIDSSASFFVNSIVNSVFYEEAMIMLKCNVNPSSRIVSVSSNTSNNSNSSRSKRSRFKT
jgi:hypothetical protein